MRSFVKLLLLPVLLLAGALALAGTSISTAQIPYGPAGVSADGAFAPAGTDATVGANPHPGNPNTAVTASVSGDQNPDGDQLAIAVQVNGDGSVSATVAGAPAGASVTFVLGDGRSVTVVANQDGVASVTFAFDPALDGNAGLVASGGAFSSLQA